MSRAAALRFGSDAAWARAAGPAYFMGGLAVLLAGVRGADRQRLLELAETIHPGVSTPEVFGAWLAASPLQPSRSLDIQGASWAKRPTLR